MSKAVKTFNRYLDAFCRGDVETAAAVLSDDFAFHGPILQVDNKAAFLEGAAGLGPIVRGYEMLRQWGDDNEACSIYDFLIETPKGKGAITMAEWTKVRDGTMIASRLIFDTTAFNALMP